MKIQENIPLAPFTTLQVGGPARYFAEACVQSEVIEAIRYAGERRLPLFVLGGGSNLVIADSGWPGLVLKIGITGVALETDGANPVFSAAAGEEWDRFVALTVGKNCAGLECLSGIPGTVGGAPVQNVGAYGQEVSQTITSLRLLEIATARTAEWQNVDCRFAYRTSILNTTLRDSYIVLSVTFRLAQNGPAMIEYADLKKFFAGTRPDKRPSLQQVRDAVRNVRRSKAMLIVAGDEDCRSAGSFFKNPIVTPAEAARVSVLAHKRVPERAFPQYPTEDGTKLSAAWLVEQAGFHKGYSRGPVGISRKHSLAIVNRGGALAQDIVALKDEVQKRVFDVWGVRLESEPVFVGFGEAADRPSRSAYPNTQ